MIIEIKKRGDKMDFGRTLLEFRAKYNLTQKQLADYLGITVMAIYRYENNKNKPSQVNKIKFENKMKEYEVKKNENASL